VQWLPGFGDSAGASTAQSLTVNFVEDTAISVKLPANLTGLLTLKVVAAAGAADTIGIMAAAPHHHRRDTGEPAIRLTAGGTAPAAQPIQIANSGTGTAALSWTAKGERYLVERVSRLRPRLRRRSPYPCLRRL